MNIFRDSFYDFLRECLVVLTLSYLQEQRKVSSKPSGFSLTFFLFFSFELKSHPPDAPTPCVFGMRKIPSQVPSAVSRLLQGQVISTPPTWFNPVLSHPPPQLPPYQVKSRPRASDSGIKSGDFIDTVPIPAGELERRDKLRGYKQRKGRPLEIAYEEDRVRRQFFKDFPFEALRPVSMVEGREIDVRGKVLGEEWVRLEQRGSYPTVEE